jgi:hypothetical protein
VNSQRLLADHFVLDLDQGKDGFGNVADLAEVEHHPLQDPPPLEHQREAAFAW